MSFYVSLFSEVLEPNKESKDDFFSMTCDPPMGLSKVRKSLHCKSSFYLTSQTAENKMAITRLIETKIHLLDVSYVSTVHP